MEKITEAMENKDCCFVHESKERSAEEIKDLVCRLNRIEGQIRGIKTMVEQNAYCVDVLTQAAAANAALQAFNKELLRRHINTCVVRDMRAGKPGADEELIDLLGKLMK